jgi:hypothetical protein
MLPVLMLALGLRLPLAAQGAPPSLSADEVIGRFLERSRTTTNRMAAQHHICVRRTVLEELADDGSVKERKTKEQAVELRGERQRIRLLKLDDRTPTADEMKREQEREAERRRPSPTARTSRAGRGRGPTSWTRS